MKARHPLEVLLLAYGGPESVGELPGFLRDIFRGPVPAGALQKATERYVRIGGRSPLCEITRRQARALEGLLGEGARVSCAFRHGKPSIEEAVDAIARGGGTRIIALAMTPFLSLSEASGYRRELGRAAGQSRVDAELIEGWHEHPGLIEAYAETLRQAKEGAPGAGGNAGLVFVSHSLPERLLPHGDPYTRHLAESACAVADSAGFEEWGVAFLGRGETGAWLGPETDDLFAEFRERELRRVVLCPLGYLVENAETLYDCDIECRAQARRAGLVFERAPAPCDSPALIRVLADLVRRASPVP